MIKKSKKEIPLNPKFVKDEKGKVTSILLDIDAYEVAMAKIKKFEKIKKSINKKNQQ